MSGEPAQNAIPEEAEMKDQANSPSTTPNKENMESSSPPDATTDSKDGKPEARESLPLHHETPAAVRTRRHIQKEMHMSSPSDTMLSPCTSKLFGKKAVSGPMAMLRNKQFSAVPFKLTDDAEMENDD